MTGCARDAEAEIARALLGAEVPAGAVVRPALLRDRTSGVTVTAPDGGLLSGTAEEAARFLGIQAPAGEDRSPVRPSPAGHRRERPPS